VCVCVPAVQILRKWDDNIGMNITIKASFYGNWITVKDRIDLCYFGSLAYTKPDDMGDDLYDGAGACPLRIGSYDLVTSFTVPKFQPDKILDFTPDLYIEFVKSSNEEEIVGCANTGTVAMLHHGRRHSNRGALAFTFSILALLILFIVCTIGHRRKARRSYNNNNTTNHLVHSNYVNQANVTESTLRRFQYRRTTRTGTVLVGHPSSSSAGAGLVASLSMSGMSGGIGSADGSSDINNNNNTSISLLRPSTAANKNGENVGGLSTMGLAGMSIPGGGHGEATTNANIINDPGAQLLSVGTYSLNEMP
jgi:hypothetical protein